MDFTLKTEKLFSNPMFEGIKLEMRFHLCLLDQARAWNEPVDIVHRRVRGEGHPFRWLSPPLQNLRLFQQVQHNFRNLRDRPGNRRRQLLAEIHNMSDRDPNHDNVIR